MIEHEQAPPGVDVSTPNVARMYDYYLRGKDNFAADREAADEVIAAMPDTPRVCRANRDFLGRVVRFLIQAGICQFIDVGTGLPTQGHVHEVARRLAPDARVVYVDNDPVVIAHARALINTSNAAFIQADIRHPQMIINHPELRNLISFNEPIGVLFIAVMQFVTDAEDPWGILSQFRDAVPLGSYLALSTIHMAEHDRGSLLRSAEVYERANASVTFRSRDEIARFFNGLDLLDPGLVRLSQWRPDNAKAAKAITDTWALGGLGYKPDLAERAHAS